MNVTPDKKIAGLLVPLFALRGENDLGIGDVAALKEFIDWSAENGFRLVQLLPINEVGADNSPYNAISARALEPTTLHLAPGSPADLTKSDFAAVTAGVNLDRIRGGAVKYPRVRKLKQQLLEKAFTTFKCAAAEERRTEFRGFCDGEATWLDDYTLFRVLMERNNGSAMWDEWPEEYSTIEKARVWLTNLPAAVAGPLQERREFFAYAQWIAHRHWTELKRHAEAREVALMGDIPFGVSYYSADVFARPNEFALDWSGGAPPEPYFKDDEFTQKWGQNWGIPVYRWELMRANNFQWWRNRVRGVKEVFHLFRIDHILGFYRIYSFPWRPKYNAEMLPLSWDEMLQRTGGRAPHFAPRDDQSWENAEANRREGEEYLRAVLDESGATRVVGEDLGTVPDYVRPNLRSLGIAGFKIPQWETTRDHRVIPGEEYERLSVATFATHDHKPIRTLWHDAFESPGPFSDQARVDLERIAAFAGMPQQQVPPDFDRDFFPAMMRALLRSEAWIAIIMITDLFSQRDRFNVPGTDAATNWAHRLRLSVARLRTSQPVKTRMRLMQGLLEESGRI